jgi:hypothetical protein
VPGWRSGYRVSLENSFPQGFPGSNPGPGASYYKMAASRAYIIKRNNT